MKFNCKCYGRRCGELNNDNIKKVVMSNSSRGNQDPNEYLMFLNEEANKQEKNINELEAKKTELASSISSMENLLISKQEEYDKFSTTIDKKIETKEKEATIIIDKIESLKLEQQEYDKVLDTTKALIINNQNVLKKQEETKEIALNNINELNTRYTELQTRFRDMSSELNNTTSDVNSSREILAKLKEDIAKAELLLASTIKSNENQSALNKQEFSELESKRKELEIIKIEADNKLSSISIFENERKSYLDDMNDKIREIEIREKESIERNNESIRRAEDLSKREKEHVLKEQEMDIRERMLNLKVKQYKLDEKE